MARLPLLRMLSLAERQLLRDARAGELRVLFFALLVAALLTPRPPSMMVLNEPETSLHPDLLPALAAATSAATTGNSQTAVIWSML